MELSDGLLLQVNNGEQGGNRWKHSNEDSVRPLKHLPSQGPSGAGSVSGRPWDIGKCILKVNPKVDPNAVVRLGGN